MSRFQTHLASAFAAILIVTVSINAIITIPPAQAQIHAIELA